MYRRTRLKDGITFILSIFGSLWCWSHPYFLLFPPKEALYVFGSSFSVVLQMLIWFLLFSLLYWIRSFLESRKKVWLIFIACYTLMIVAVFAYQSTNNIGYFTQEGMFLRTTDNPYIDKKIGWGEIKQSPILVTIGSGKEFYQFTLNNTVIADKTSDLNNFDRLVALLIDKNIDFDINIVDTDYVKRDNLQAKSEISAFIYRMVEESQAMGRYDKANYYESKLNEITQN